MLQLDLTCVGYNVLVCIVVKFCEVIHFVCFLLFCTYMYVSFVFFLSRPTSMVNKDV